MLAGALLVSSVSSLASAARRVPDPIVPCEMRFGSGICAEEPEIPFMGLGERCDWSTVLFKASFSGLPCPHERCSEPLCQRALNERPSFVPDRIMSLITRERFGSPRGAWGRSGPITIALLPCLRRGRRLQARRTCVCLPLPPPKCPPNPGSLCN